jgi:hypothetical protein
LHHSHNFSCYQQEQAQVVLPAVRAGRPHRLSEFPPTDTPCPPFMWCTTGQHETCFSIYGMYIDHVHPYES